MSEDLQLIIPLIIGGIAVPMINALKKTLNPNNQQLAIKIGDYTFFIDFNLLIAFGVSMVLAVFALFITDAFSGGPITAARIVGWVSLAFSVATIIYKGVKDTVKARSLDPSVPV